MRRKLCVNLPASLATAYKLLVLFPCSPAQTPASRPNLWRCAAEFQSWEKVDPSTLFDAPTLKSEANPKARVCRHLQQEAKGADYLVGGRARMG